jgi:hypothetical protein
MDQYANLKKATAAQTKAYIEAIQKGESLPNGFLWTGGELYVDPDAKESDTKSTTTRTDGNATS